MTANVSAALLLALQVASRDPSPATNMKAVEVERGTEELLHVRHDHEFSSLAKHSPSARVFLTILIKHFGTSLLNASVAYARSPGSTSHLAKSTTSSPK